MSVLAYQLIFSVQTPITEGGIGGVEYLKDGIDKLIQLMDKFVVKYYAWNTIEQTRAGLGLGFQYCKRYLFDNFMK